MSCNNCGACCTFFKLPIEGLNEDARRWLLSHDGVMIGGGNIYINNKCGYLGSDNKCSIYAKRFECCKKMPVNSALCVEAREVKSIFT